MLTNDTIKDVDYLRDVLNEMSFEMGVDRAALLTHTSSGEALYFLVCTDPDGEWFFIEDVGDNGKWRYLSLDDLPRFSGSHLMAAMRW